MLIGTLRASSGKASWWPATYIAAACTLRSPSDATRSMVGTAVYQEERFRFMARERLNGSRIDDKGAGLATPTRVLRGDNKLNNLV